MEFNKPPEWGSRFKFPENQKFDFHGLQMRVTDKIIVQMIDDYENAVASEIASAARVAGVSDVTVLNKKAILDALQKQIPKKPEEAVDYESCVDWMCATCGRFHRTEWKPKYCSECGQALDWGDA